MWLVQAGGEGRAEGIEREGEAQEDNEDVTTKEDDKLDGLVSAYWETIGTYRLCALHLAHVLGLELVSTEPSLLACAPH